MNLVDIINESWGWTGAQFSSVIAQSPMGHLILSDSDDAIFYLDPDGMELVPLGDRDAAEKHLAGEEARELWSGGQLVLSAVRRLGAPPAGSVLNLKPMSLVQGDYSPENMWIVSLEELIRFTGDVARQIKDLPDGSQIEIKVTD